LPGELAHLGDNRSIGFGALRLEPEPRPRRPEQRARSSQRYAPRLCESDLLPATERAYHFFRFTSFKTAMSSMLSASIFFSFVFSGFQRFQPLRVVDVHAAELPLPLTDGLGADAVLLRDLGDRALVRLAEDPNHLRRECQLCRNSRSTFRRADQRPSTTLSGPLQAAESQGMVNILKIPF
jgi:hypothetical protein